MAEQGEKDAKVLRRRLIDAIRQVLILCLIIGAATSIGWLFLIWNFPETNIVVVYILSVLLTARFTQGYTYGIIASIAAACMFNYFFTEPYFTLSVKDPTYFVTFTIMTITAIITSALISKIKQNASEASERETESSALYQLTNRLTDAADIPSIVSITVQAISSALCCRAACLCFDTSGNPEPNFLQQKSDDEQIHRDLHNRDEIEQRITHLHAEYDVGEEFYDWPIYGRDAILGILRIPVRNAEILSKSQIRLLHSMIESTALAMDRFRNAQERIKSREEAEQERYRSNLLRAISHDLRTPLSGIMGTSEMLMDMTEPSDERHILAEGIYKDADWLHAMVENILSLTRLQAGKKLKLNRQLEPVEEIVGVAVMVIERREAGREITVSVPDTVLMVPMDAKLIEQVLVNLLDNARKHTPLDKEISIRVDTDPINNYAVFTVADRGTGIAKADLPHIFQMFYTTQGKIADAERGIGLGLTICESIVKAHGGTITAANRQEGTGAVFTFTLPLEVQQRGQTN